MHLSFIDDMLNVVEKHRANDSTCPETSRILKRLHKRLKVLKCLEVTNLCYLAAELVSKELVSKTLKEKGVKND